MQRLLTLCLFLMPLALPAEPLRLAVLGMPLDEIETEAEQAGPEPQPPPSEPGPVRPDPEGGAPAKKPASPATQEAQAPGPDAAGYTDMALFRILRDTRHGFFQSTLALPVFGNKSRLDPDLCLAVSWSADARWQSRLCYSAIYGELQERDAASGEVLGRFGSQWSDGRVDLLDYIIGGEARWMLGVGWTLSRYLIDFDRSGQSTELGGIRYDSRTTLTQLASGVQLGGYYRTREGSVLRALWALEAPVQGTLEQYYFVGNDFSASAEQGLPRAGLVTTLSLSLSRALGRRLEGTLEVRYRRLPIVYETRMIGDTPDGPVQLIDRFEGSDGLLRSGLRLAADVPWASVDPYVEGALFYSSNKDEGDREYLYYSGYRLFLGVSRLF